jgi:predicted secreted protein
MGTAGNRAFGVAITLDSATIGEVTNLNGIELTADTIEMTSHDSTSRYREYIQGLRDGGEFSIEGNHVPADAGQAKILEVFGEDDPVTATIIFADASDWSASVIVTAYKPADSPIDDKLAFSTTFKVTGVPTFTPT